LLLPGLARCFAEIYPQHCAMISVPGAERFSATIELAPAADPLRVQTAQAFSEFSSVSRAKFTHVTASP
jgi:hypothetical protein